MMAGQHSWKLVVNGHHQVVELLLKEKADPNIKDNNGQTALMAASLKMVIIKWWSYSLKKKADPNIPDSDGRTALMAASRKGHQQVVELLLKEKADPNIENNDSQTAALIIKETNTKELNTVANVGISEEMIASLHQEYTHTEDTSSHQFDSKKAQEKKFDTKLKVTKKRLVNEDEQSNKMNFTIESESLSMQEGRNTIKSMLPDSIRNPFSSFKKQKRKKLMLENKTMKMRITISNFNF